MILLEQARNPNPWKLITNPTILDYPISPNKRNITFLFTIFGFFFAIAVALFKNIKEEIAYEKKAIEKIMESKVIFELNSVNKKEVDNLAKLISSKIEKEKTFSKIISTYNIEDEFIKNFEGMINRYTKSETIKISSELIIDDSTNSVITLIPIGVSRYSYLKKIKDF